VASVGTKSLFFKGNPCAYIRRRYAARRRKLGKAKKLNAIRKSKGKEVRSDDNYKISRQIVNFAMSYGVGIIHMEDLTGVRNLAKSQKEAGRNLRLWAFLERDILLQAEMAGIRFELVNPKFTSQTCKCGYWRKANRNGLFFQCKACGYTCHADLNGQLTSPKRCTGRRHAALVGNR
jgi:IS605 OrfB family transposase